MAEYISSFTTGFESVIIQDLKHNVKGIKILNSYGGLVHYEYPGDISNLFNISYFNNTYYILKTYYGGNLNFNLMFEKAKNCIYKNFFNNKMTFRIRYVKENQFTKVDKSLMDKAELIVKKKTNMKVDRVNPKCEFWYIIRRENIGFYACLMKKREITERDLNKGELRPEIAYLMCLFADIKKSDVICEPFSGFGSIPNQIIHNFKYKKIFLSDIDEKKVSYMKKRFKGKKDYDLRAIDANCLFNIENESVDLVISDPPWGIYENIDDIYLFYTKILMEMKRIIKETGRIILITAKKVEMETAVCDSGLFIKDNINVLINGKKANIYKIQKN